MRKLLIPVDLLVKINLFMFCSAAALAAQGKPFGLKDVFQAALKRSEDLAGQEELIIQAEERLTQTKGALFPTVVGTVSYLVQPNPVSPTGSSISPPNQTTIKFTASQPLFQGLKEYASLRFQKVATEVSYLNLEQAKVQLFQDVVQSYYQVLSWEKELKNLQNEIELNQKRLKELEHFKKLGRSRETEVLTLQANIAALEAQVYTTNGQLENARTVFSFLTGLEKNSQLYDSESFPNQKQSVEQYLDRIELRPDIQSLKKSVEMANEGIVIARGGHFPTLGLLGNYYMQRPGLLSNVNWDLQLNLTLPIFQGGIVQSQVRQAASVEKQSELTLSKGRRQARQQIESYFSLFQSDYSQYLRQKTAVDLAMRNYQAELRDYRLGLVTNIEFLQSLTAYQANQRTLDRTIFQLKADFLKLQAVSALKGENSR